MIISKMTEPQIRSEIIALNYVLQKRLESNLDSTNEWTSFIITTNRMARLAKEMQKRCEQWTKVI